MERKEENWLFVMINMKQVVAIHSFAAVVVSDDVIIFSLFFSLSLCKVTFRKARREKIANGK